ncbi:MAG: ribosomal protein [Pseudomonadota bacterium]|jgi:small subunit ribosomal protein S1
MSAENLQTTQDGAANTGSSTSSPEPHSQVTPLAEARAPEALADEAPSPAAAQGDAVEASRQSSESEQPGEKSDKAASADGEAKQKRKRKRRKKKPNEAKGESHKPSTERAPFQVGEEVFGKVTAVLPHAIMVDLAGKALGIFDRGEMEPDDLVPAEGDRMLARVHRDGVRGGLIVLTRKPLREELSKPAVEAALKSGELVGGLITGVIKGGVDVDINGVRAFAPASGMDLHPQNANFAALVGSRLEFKVTQFESNGRDVVVTRRPLLEAEAHKSRKKALTLLEAGQKMTGVVRTVVDWGIFVALTEAENLEGLVHATEASHDPRANLAELFSTGDRIEVVINKIDERGKIWLSRKALIADPWKEAKDKYPQGGKFKAQVTRVEKFGAFVQLDGIEGLIHIADLSLNRVEHASEVVKPGDEIEVVVNQFDLKNHRVSLHLALAGAAADEKPQKQSKNSNLDVEVIKPEPAGLVVRILGATGRQARAFIPAGQTGTERGADLRKSFPVGAKLRAAVLDIDPRRGELKLSLSRLAENEERQAHKEYRQKLAAEGGFGTLGDLLKKRR